MDDLAILPAPLGTDAYVELAGSGGPGKPGKFRKHILNLGNLIHPKTGESLKLDAAWYDKLKGNWDAKVCPIVQFPAADANNKHVEGVLSNLGQVTNLTREGSKVYVDIDVPEAAVADKIRNKLIAGASAFMHLNYADSRDGKKVGPTLLHVAATNRPYCVDLEDYKEIAASNVTEGEQVVLILTPEVPPAADSTGDAADQEEPVPLSREELLAQLKAEHGIDVEALQASAAPPATDAVALSAALVDALKTAGVLQLSGSDQAVSAADLTAAVVELASTAKVQGEEIGVLKLAQAETEVDAYISAGRLLPKARGKAVELMLSGDKDGLDAFLAPASDPYVKLDNTTGTAGDEGQQRQESDIDAEMAKLAAAHPEYFDGGKK